LDPSEKSISDYCAQLTAELESKGVEVFEDDRDERPGVKFKDADLLGFPVRIVVGKKGFEAGQIEVVSRKTKNVDKLNPNQVFQKTLAILESL
jgi:prolyl-tRNA synthetase